MNDSAFSLVSRRWLLLVGALLVFLALVASPHVEAQIRVVADTDGDGVRGEIDDLPVLQSIEVRERHCFWVLDPDDDADCSVGAGSADPHICCDNGSAFVAVPGLGSGGSGDITDVWTDSSGDVSALTAAAGDSLDCGSADSCSPAPRSTTLPATCTEGFFYQDTDSTGSEVYACTATNTWTKFLAAVDLDTSAELRGILTDENGTGAALFNGATSPNFTTDVQVGSVSACLEDGTNCPGSSSTIEYDPDNYPPAADDLGSDEFANNTPALTWTQQNADGQAVLYVRDASVLTAGGVSDAWHGDTTGVPADTGQDWYVIAKVTGRQYDEAVRGCGISLITGGTAASPTEINSIYLRATSSTAAALAHNDHDDYDFAGVTGIGANSDVSASASDTTRIQNFWVYLALQWVDATEDIRSSWSWNGLQWHAGNTDTTVDGYPVAMGKFSRDDESCVFEFVRFLDTDVDADGTTLLRIGS